MLTVGSLFAGIGGFDLGLERAGMRSVWQCEIDPFAQHVLAKHWPDVLRVPDIRNVGADTVPYVDVICGGFPCQDLSYAGKGAGLAGERSGLWSEYARVVGELRPRYVVVENVAALLARGLSTVVGDLAALGYDAEWDCLPASAFGAPHRRDRLWLVAYPSRDLRARTTAAGTERQRAWSSGEPGGAHTDADRRGFQERSESDSRPARSGQPAPQRSDAYGLRSPMADADQFGRGEGVLVAAGRVERPGPADAVGSGPVGDANSASTHAHAAQGASRRAASEPGWWSSEPDVGRVAHGVPARVDRLRSLGNALVPQIAEWLGTRILEWEGLAE